MVISRESAEAEAIAKRSGDGGPGPGQARSSMSKTRSNRIAPVLLGAIAQWLSGCASTAVAPYAGDAPRDDVVYLITGGWHTEIGLSRSAARALPRALLDGFPDARYLVFGWGERGYYTSPDPGVGDALRALAPGPAALLVVPLSAPPTEAFKDESVLTLPVSSPGIERLDAYLGGYVATDVDGRPRLIGPGPERGSAFYASTGDYSIARTCNTWTAEALHVAGLPVDAAGVVFASQVRDEAQPLALPRQ
jgi:uncharacterized protein (TIGR02117 family)